MKIAITGSSGFVGKHLVARFLQLGHDVLPLDIVNGVDITDINSLINIGSFDVLVHLAARTFVPDSFKNSQSFYYTNIVGTINALELCKIHNAKMIFASSYIYGNPKYLPVDEKHPICAHNPYAQTKIIGEEICTAYARDFNVPVIILRPFNIYGPDQNCHFLIPKMVKQAQTGHIKLADPEPKRDFVYIDDVINAYVKSVEYLPNGAEIFNIGSGISYSISEITALINAAMSKDVGASFTGEKRPNEVLETVADISKAQEKLGWVPNILLMHGIKKMVEDKKEII